MCSQAYGAETTLSFSLRGTAIRLYLYPHMRKESNATMRWHRLKSWLSMTESEKFQRSQGGYKGDSEERRVCLSPTEYRIHCPNPRCISSNLSLRRLSSKRLLDMSLWHTGSVWSSLCYARHANLCSGLARSSKPARPSRLLCVGRRHRHHRCRVPLQLWQWRVP